MQLRQQLGGLGWELVVQVNFEMRKVLEGENGAGNRIR